MGLNLFGDKETVRTVQISYMSMVLLFSTHHLKDIIVVNCMKQFHNMFPLFSIESYKMNNILL